MRVGVLGSGDVGRVLATGFVDRGDDVVIGTRHPEKKELVDWAGEHGGSIGSFAQAGEHGELVVLALQGAAALGVVEDVGAPAFQGKVVMDVTNPLQFEGEGPPGLFVGTDDSLSEAIQRTLPGARVVKAFNTVPNVQMVDPSFEGPAPELLICGNEADAKATVAEVAVSFGWPGVLDVGDLSAARWLEAMVPLWARVGAVLDTWGHAFRVARPS